MTLEKSIQYYVYCIDGDSHTVDDIPENHLSHIEKTLAEALIAAGHDEECVKENEGAEHEMLVFMNDDQLQDLSKALKSLLLGN